MKDTTHTMQRLGNSRILKAIKLTLVNVFAEPIKCVRDGYRKGIEMRTKQKDL